MNFSSLLKPPPRSPRGTNGGFLGTNGDLMKVVCSGCKEIMGHKAGPAAEESHSICRKCWPIYYPDIPPFPECEAEWKFYEEQSG